MRVTANRLMCVQFGYVLIADVLGADEPEMYVVGNRSGYVGLLTELTARPDVLQVHSHRRVAMDGTGRHHTLAEDFGTMAGFLFSGDEFALDGRGEEDDQ